MPRKAKNHVSESFSSTLRSIHPPLPGHPISSALREAWLHRWEQIEDLIRRGKAPNEKEAMARASKIAQLGEESVELLGWVSPSYRPLSRKQSDLLAETMIEAGCPASEVLKVAAESQKRPRGAPASKRSFAVTALELRRVPHSLSWAQIAKRLCQCKKEDREKPGHLSVCAQRIRQAAIGLKRTLKKYGINTPGGSRTQSRFQRTL